MSILFLLSYFLDNDRGMIETSFFTVKLIFTVNYFTKPLLMMMMMMMMMMKIIIIIIIITIIIIIGLSDSVHP